MALTTFSELKQAIIDYVHRSDLDLKIQDFITLAEHEMYNPGDDSVEPLRLKEFDKTSTASVTTTSRFLALPDDYSSLRSTRLDITDLSDFMEYRAPQQMRRFDTTARPCFFTIIGTQIEFDRVPDDTYTIEIQYYAELAALTAAAPTNELLTEHPNIYLFGGVHQAFVFAKDQESAGTYEAKFLKAIKGANKADRKGRFGPAPVMKVEGSTP